MPSSSPFRPLSTEPLLSSPRAVDVPDLVAQARSGRPRAVARLISLVEDAHPSVPALMEALMPYAGRAHVIGLTGAPGVGKSTTTSALVAAFRARGARVGVLAVDPSSPFSGGALLADPEVFIRSMATRGHLGGLSWAAPAAVRVLDAVGCDVVLVETVGVGQSEVEVAGAADTTIVLLAPGLGDGIQAAKAGILEIGDIFVVNKADREGADATVHDLRHMVALAERRDAGAWRPPVVKTVAMTGHGIEDLMSAVDKHRSWLHVEHLQERRVDRAVREIEALALERLRTRTGAPTAQRAVRDLAAAVVAGRTSPYAAAEQVVAVLTSAQASDR